jgi:hypothetical protein
MNSHIKNNEIAPLIHTIITTWSASLGSNFEKFAALLNVLAKSIITKFQ